MKRERERERERGVLFLFSCLCVQSETLENFAFCKAEVLFWQKTDAETLKRYVSLRAIFGEIFCILVALSGKSAPDPGFHRSFSWRIHSCSWIEGFNVSAVQSIELPELLCTPGNVVLWIYLWLCFNEIWNQCSRLPCVLFWWWELRSWGMIRRQVGWSLSWCWDRSQSIAGSWPVSSRLVNLELSNFNIFKFLLDESRWKALFADHVDHTKNFKLLN